MRKRSVTTLAAFAVVIVAAMIGFRLMTRPLPFDSIGWRSGDAKIRFRMKDSLVAKQQSGEIATRDVVDQVLGPDDEPGNDLSYRYFRITEWYGNPWYLRVRFDGQGKVEQFIVAPD